MTSNRSFFKLQRELIRRNLILPVLSGIGFFFILPLFTLMMLQNQISSHSSYIDSARLKDIISSTASDTLLSDMQYGVKFGIVIMASLAAFILFRYLHSSKQVDFFHSLPISRGNLFVQLYLTGFMSVIPLYIIMYFAAVICCFAMGAGLYITGGLIFKTLAINIIYFLLFYSLAALSVILSGNTFISVCIYGLLNVIVPATAYMLSGLFDLAFDTYINNGFLESMANKFFPALRYFSRTPSTRTIGVLIGTLIVAVIISVISCMLFKVRKSERAGSALSFYSTKVPLKCYLTLMCGYSFMFIFSSIAGQSWRYIGIFFGVILAHIVFEALYNFDIRSLFKNWKTMIALLVVAFGFLTVLKADITGYDRKIPNEADMSSVSFNCDYPNVGYNSSYLSTFNDLTDAKNIASVLKLAQYGVDNLDNEIYNNQDIVQDDKNTYINIHYTLKNGSKMARHYNIPITDEYIGYLEDIMFTEDFMKNQSRSIFDLQIDKLVNIEISIRTQSTTSSDISATVIDIPKATDIIKTLREESLTLTKEQAQTQIPVLRLDIDTNYYDEMGYVTNDFVNYIPVYSTYTKTLALIEKYTGVKPEPLTADKIANIQIGVYDEASDELSAETRKKIDDLLDKSSGDYSVYIDDADTISKVIENAFIEEIANSTNSTFKLHDNYPFYLRVNMKNNTESGLVYPEDKFPIELLANIILGNLNLSSQFSE